MDLWKSAKEGCVWFEFSATLFSAFGAVRVSRVCFDFVLYNKNPVPGRPPGKRREYSLLRGLQVWVLNILKGKKSVIAFLLGFQKR